MVYFPPMSTTHLLILSTAPDIETAEKLAKGLIEQRLAACVNLLPQAMVFAGLGARFNYQGFVGGVMLRFPLTDLWKTGESAPVIFSFYIGGELKKPQ